MLPKEALDEFKQLYAKNFGEQLSDSEALDKATKLLDLYKTVLSVPRNKQT